MADEKDWEGRKYTPEEYRDLLKLLHAVGVARRNNPLLGSTNQYLISSALTHYELMGYECDKTVLEHYTGLQRSSLHYTLELMRVKELVIFERSEKDARRTLIRSTELLLDQHIEWLDTCMKLLEIAKNRR